MKKEKGIWKRRKTEGEKLVIWEKKQSIIWKKSEADNMEKQK